MAEHVVRWSMTATREELLRVLPPELLAAGVLDGSRLRGGQDGRHWELVLAPAPRLRVGALDLAVTELEIRLRGYDAPERARFLERLEQCTRRGGG